MLTNRREQAYSCSLLGWFQMILVLSSVDETLVMETSGFSDLELPSDYFGVKGLMQTTFDEMGPVSSESEDGLQCSPLEQ